MAKAGAGPIYIALGANLPHPVHGPAQETLKAALAELDRHGVGIRRLSRWYRSAPVPPSDQPWYINAVAEVASDLDPDALLAELHAVEEIFGRVRTVPNAPRLIDLDLLDYRGEIAAGGPGRATLPHPRMAGRAFVLKPLADVAPHWRHPVSRASVGALLAAMSPDDVASCLLS